MMKQKRVFWVLVLLLSLSATIIYGKPSVIIANFGVKTNLIDDEN